jgi:conjugative transposon TraK protein
MFKQLRNIETAFSHVRVFTGIVVTACASLTGFSVYKSFQLVSEAHEKIYVLANGKALEAWSEERKDNIPVEAKDHIKMFHWHFFTLSPDDKVIEANVTKALYLADGSAKRQYDNLKESRYYSNLISGNISQEIMIDSIVLKTNQYPFHFTCHARQKLIRTTSVVVRSLITEGQLRSVLRSDNNPHGFLIERWRTLENKDIKIENR